MGMYVHVHLHTHTCACVCTCGWLYTYHISFVCKSVGVSTHAGRHTYVLRLPGGVGSVNALVLLRIARRKGHVCPWRVGVGLVFCLLCVIEKGGRSGGVERGAVWEGWGGHRSCGWGEADMMDTEREWCNKKNESMCIFSDRMMQTEWWRWNDWIAVYVW